MRHPGGTGYAGPLANYDTLISPETFMRRAVYGRPEPLLSDRQRMDTPFFGRLFDELANAHVAYIKECRAEGSARSCATHLRKELPSEVYEVGIQRDDPIYPGWHIFVYNRIERWMATPRWHEPIAPTRDWLDSTEASKILHVSPFHVRRLVVELGIPHRRIGGRSAMLLPRTALVTLANRPKRRRPRQPKRTTQGT